jgi:hypothetical protein
VPDPRQAGVQYFAATGHTLRGDFLTYWTKYGGLAQFGYPITEEFSETSGPGDQPALTVQYFERARFEHHPENQDPYRVLLGALGKAFHKPDPPVPAQANPLARYFGETGHNVMPPFLTYWEAHGGLFVNGYPISEPFEEVNPIDGKKYTVQYFERARFELHLENAGTPYEVLLGLLGTQQARALGYFATSAYPRLGRAADWSWVAGQVVRTNIQGGCTFLRYEDGGAQILPGGDAWYNRPAAVGQPGSYVVVFGHPRRPGEPFEVCPGGEPYTIESIQVNPATTDR